MTERLVSTLTVWEGDTQLIGEVGLGMIFHIFA